MFKLDAELLARPTDFDPLVRVGHSDHLAAEVLRHLMIGDIMNVANKLTVHESLHHGDFRAERDLIIPPTWDGFVELLNTSPYCYDREAGSNRYSAMSFANLLTTGKCEVGWSRFTVTDKA